MGKTEFSNTLRDCMNKSALDSCKLVDLINEKYKEKKKISSDASLRKYLNGQLPSPETFMQIAGVLWDKCAVEDRSAIQELYAAWLDARMLDVNGEYMYDGIHTFLHLLNHPAWIERKKTEEISDAVSGRIDPDITNLPEGEFRFLSGKEQLVQTIREMILIRGADSREIFACEVLLSEEILSALEIMLHNQDNGSEHPKVYHLFSRWKQSFPCEKAADSSPDAGGEQQLLVASILRMALRYDSYQPLCAYQSADDYADKTGEGTTDSGKDPASGRYITNEQMRNMLIAGNYCLNYSTGYENGILIHSTQDQQEMFRRNMRALCERAEVFARKTDILGVDSIQGYFRTLENRKNTTSDAADNTPMVKRKIDVYFFTPGISLDMVLTPQVIEAELQSQEILSDNNRKLLYDQHKVWNGIMERIISEIKPANKNTVRARILSSRQGLLYTVENRNVSETALTGMKTFLGQNLRQCFLEWASFVNKRTVEMLDIPFLTGDCPFKMIVTLDELLLAVCLPETGYSYIQVKEPELVAFAYKMLEYYEKACYMYRFSMGPVYAITGQDENWSIILS